MPVIDINGLRVNYTDTGNGLAVVFIPGLGGSKEWFCYQASGLADHYRVISYDLRRARGRANYSLGLLVDDLAKFLSALRVHVAVIAGHSLGGLVALRFAVEYPDRCLVLVLSSTTPSFPHLSDEELISELLPGELRRESFIAGLWKRLFGSKENETDDSDPLSHLTQATANIDQATIRARLKLLRESDLTPVLDSVAAPALIVAGSLEKSHILAGSQLLDEKLSDSTLEIIENADQYYFYTRHDQFNELLSDYLAHNIARP